MKLSELIQHLVATLDDAALSRSERRALRVVLDEHPLGPRDLQVLQAALYDAAAEAMHDPRDGQVLRWLEATSAALRAHDAPSAPAVTSRAWFGPQDPLAALLASQLEAARQGIDAAVFTITDDRIAAALIAAHQRQVRVRILTDDDKAGDPGSDIWRLQRAGIPVRTDHSPSWMHHKFAVIDGHTLINGSYNWTRAASRDNRENFLISGDPQLVQAYQDAFERLWTEFAPTA
jgi:mitochondrial cardiolipin hydrolase